MGLKAAYLFVIKKFPKEPYGGQCTSGFIVSRKKDDLVNEAKHLSNEFHFHSFFSVRLFSVHVVHYIHRVN